MRRRKVFQMGAALAALSLVLAGCGGDDGPEGAEAAFDAASTGIVNPSDKTGGVLKYVLSDEPDSVDPGNTYYAMMWDFTRLYSRALLNYKAEPGDAGLELVPDLAEGLGESSDDLKTWTYKIRSGVKYEDGSPVTSKDVKYAVARSNWGKDVLPNGPGYFAQFVDAGDYAGPYKDPNLDNLKGIETPDDQTIVFRLKEPFADFDYLVANPQTAPVPQAKDTGAKYQEHPLSTGPYMVESHSVGQRLVLTKNPNWDAGSDPTRKQLVDKIELDMKVDANEIDNRLISGAAHVDLAGTGVQAAARARVLGDENVKKNADNPYAGFLWYIAISTKVSPLDNVECRRAVLYAADHVALQNAYGGPEAGGDIGSTVLPPNNPAYEKADQYGLTTDTTGNAEKAKQALEACGQPNGFTTNISFRSDRPREVSGSQALQEALAKVGIKAELKGYPAGKYFTNFAGAPDFVNKNGLGLMFTGWAADWPSGFGFLQQIVDGRTIRPQGNTNMSELNDPAINKLFDDYNRASDVAERNSIGAEIDKTVMEQAGILPIVYAKSLIYRHPSLTNVYVNPVFGMYDYTQLGLE